MLWGCTQAPQPFRHERTGVDTSSLRLRDGGTVLILPIEGPARPLSKIIARSLADSLGVRNIPSTSNPLDNPTYKVRGQLVSSSKKDDRYFKGQFYWTFMDQSGSVVEEAVQDLHMSREKWDYGDQATVEQMVEEAAERIAGYLQDKRARENAAQVGDQEIVYFHIDGIEGARGDGQQALKKAMELTLRQAGAKVLSLPDERTFGLRAHIDIFDPFEGNERIRIDWIVARPDGTELGRASQNNQMPEGTFDQPWGRLAYHIARAALPGIADVVERHRAEEKWQERFDSEGSPALPGQRRPLVIPPF